MPRISVYVGSSLRTQIDQLSKYWKLGNAETLRRLIVLGLGGDENMANELNAQMAVRKRAAEKFYGQERQPGPREASSNGEHSPVVTIRLPSNWSQAVKDRGGLKAVLERGYRSL